MKPDWKFTITIEGGQFAPLIEAYEAQRKTQRVCNHCKHLGGDDFCTRMWITPILARDTHDLYSVGAMDGDTERMMEPNIEIDDPTTFGCNQWEKKDDE